MEIKVFIAPLTKHITAYTEHNSKIPMMLG